MSSPHDHTTATTDLLPTRATRRYRTPRRPAATPPATPLPQPTQIPQPAQTRRRGDRHADAHPPHQVSATPGNGLPPAAEPSAPLRALPSPLADVVTIRQPTHVEHALALRPGATATDLTTAMIMIPPGATLVGHRPGTGLSLLFRESPDDPTGRPAAGTGTSTGTDAGTEAPA